MTENGKHRILIIDDSSVDLEILSIVCGSLDCEVDLATDGNEALSLYYRKKHDLVVTDYQMEPMNGIYVVSRIREMNPDAQFVMITGFPDNTVESFTRNNDLPELVTKPFHLDRLIGTLKEALHTASQATGRIHGHALKKRMEDCPILIGQSESICKLRENLVQCVGETTPLLLEGADGVGKLEIARLLHKYGAQSRGACEEFHCERGLNQSPEKSLFDLDGRWGRVLERAQGGTLILHSVERLDQIGTTQLIRQFEQVTQSMRLIALEGCVTVLGLDPVEMDRELYNLFTPHTIRLPELSERREDILSIIRAVSKSPIQFGLARVLEDAEVEQIAQELKLYDFQDNFAGLFERIRKLADRPGSV